MNDIKTAGDVNNPYFRSPATR